MKRLLLLLFILTTTVFSQSQKRLWISPASVRADFWSMFGSNTGWDTLRSRIDVFSIHVNAFTIRDTARMWSAATMLRDAGVRVNIEAGGLRPFSGCDSLAGEHHAQLELDQMRRWLNRGGAIDFVTMDSPINTMIMNGDPSGTCNWTVDHAANEMVDYMKAMRMVIPSVTFALVEPVPWYSVGAFPNHPGNNYGDLLITLDTVLAVVAQRGERLEIFHSDSPYEYSQNTQTQGWKKLKAVEDYLHAHGLRHGRIHNSQDGGFQSDQLFYERTMDSWRQYKAVGGDEDEIEVWCWYDHPEVNWPETQPYTFAYTCKKFFEQTSVQKPMANFEPPDGKVYHGVQTVFGGHTNYVALLDSSTQPAVRGIFLDVPGPRDPASAIKALRNFLDTARTVGYIPSISLFLVTSQESSTGATDSLIAFTNKYDALLDSLITLMKGYGKQMFLRIGGEFNGPWNGGGYHPYIYPKAFQKIVDLCDSNGIRDSVATVWCYYPAGPNDFDSLDAKGYRWYPGDAYVDWFGLDLFNASDFDQSLPDYVRGSITQKGKAERFLSIARGNGKPVFLDETSAKGVTITADSLDGVHDWNEWFAKFWYFIGNHAEVKGFCYIDQHWDATGFPGWGDARIENNAYVSAQYQSEMKEPKYIHLPYAKPDSGGTVPEKVLLIAPRDSAVIPDSTVQLRWKTAQKDGDMYHLDVAYDARFINMVVRDSSLNDTAYSLDNLLKDGKYFWRVQAHNSAGWGPFSEIWSFSQSDSIAIVHTTANVVIDLMKMYQMWEGWGASSNFSEQQVANLDPRERKEIFDLVFDDLGANKLCIRLYSDFQTSPGGAYNWDSMAAQRMIVNEARNRGNIDYLWLKVSSPPGWMKDNGTPENGGHVTPVHYQDFADYLSYYIRHMQSDYGIPINGVSMFNEPGFNATYESTTTTPEEYRDILKVVAETFQRDGLVSVEFLGPEVGSIGQYKNYFTAILADTDAAQALDRFSAHQYGDQLFLYGTGPGDQWDWLKTQAERVGKRIWETEMYIGGVGMATNDIDEALRISLLIWNAVVNGNVSAWHYWHYIWPDESKQNKSQGLIALPRTGSYLVYPRYYGFKQWSKFIPFASFRIEAQSNNSTLKVAAFVHSTKIAMVVFNTSDSTITANFACPGFMFEHVRTSADENFVSLPPVTAVNGFTLAIKPKSINTFSMETEVGVEKTPLARDYLSLDVFPQPVRNAASIRISGQGVDPVRIALFDMLGRLVRVVHDGVLPEAGVIRTETTSLPSGLYQLRVSNGKRTSMRNVQVLH